MKRTKLVAPLLVCAMVISSFGAVAQVADAAPAAPKLSASKKTIAPGKKFNLKVKKASGVKKIVKTTWKTSKKKVAVLKKSKKTSTTVVAKKVGKANITAKVKYTLKNGKSKTKKLVCKVTVSNASDNQQTTTPTTGPESPAATTPAGGNTTPEATPTAVPTENPYYNAAGYYASYNGNNSYRGTDNLYVNYVMVDSKEVNTKSNIVEGLKFKVDSSSAFEIGIYVSEENCAANSLGDSAKVGSFTTDGTVGQEVEVALSGAAIDNLANEKISFGFYATCDKTLQMYCLTDMSVKYNNQYYPVSLSEGTVGCTGSAKGIYSTRERDSSAIISDDYTSLAELTSQKGYKFGTCVTYDQVMNDKELMNLIAKHCDSITATNEFKAYSLLDQSASKASADGMPAMNYTQADAIAQWAQDNGLKIRGHALVWDQSMTQWFFNEGYNDNVTDADGNVTNRVDSDTMKARLRHYIDQVITHFETEFPGVIYCWDVVNEGIDESASSDRLKIRQTRDGEPNPFYYVLGSDYIHYSFLCARDTLDKLGNTTIDLVYNDYNVIYGNKRTPIINLVKDINKYDGNRVLCDTVGMQGYLGYGRQSNCLGDDLVNNVTGAISELSRNGFKVQLTEMAMRNFTNTDQYMSAHASFSQKLFTALADINQTTNGAFTSMSIWAFIDEPCLNYTDDTYEYDIYTPYSGLFDEVYTAKDSFFEVYKAMGGEMP